MSSARTTRASGPQRRVVAVVVLIVASTALAASPASPASAKGTATAPGAPAIAGFTQTKRSVTIASTPPASNGGAAIFAYRATCKPTGGGETKLGYSHKSPTVVRALAAAKAYVCVVAARNRVGFSLPSASISIKAGGGTSCASAAGTGTFTPPLPRITDHTMVDSVLTTSGTISGCVGGAVTEATMTTVSLPITGTNCSVFVSGLPAPISATATITWNTNATSTVALEIRQVKGKITSTTLNGSVTAGLFAGLHLSGTSQYAVPSGACVTATLSTLTYKAVTAWNFA